MYKIYTFKTMKIKSRTHDLVWYGSSIIQLLHISAVFPPAQRYIQTEVLQSTVH